MIRSIRIAYLTMAILAGATLLAASLPRAARAAQPDGTEHGWDELVGDARLAPPSLMPSALTLFPAAPIPGHIETSEYLIGRVAVGIILPESNGALDASTEDWTAGERALVRSEIAAALDWWAALEPRAHLTFIYDDGAAAPIPTRYEPIGRPSGDQSLWIAEIMATKGYTASSYFSQVYLYNNALRQAYDTDWAFTIFVVDSSADRDNRFADGDFAYAYLGGPFMVMTYGNGNYGPTNMDAVAAHEIGHIFLALDQYTAARQACTLRSGYLDVENQNSQYGSSCASDLPSIMRGSIAPFTDRALDDYARGQVGWRDSDGDSILDPLDTHLSVTGIDYVTDTLHPNVLLFTGEVQDEPYPSPRRRSITINTIQEVAYRIAGGAWMTAQPVDGRFDAYREEFTFSTPLLPTGELAIELRVRDSAGNETVQEIATVAVVDPVDEVLDTMLTRVAQAGGDTAPAHIVYTGQSTSRDSYVAGVYYRVDGGAWQPLAADDGTFDEPREEFTLWLDLAALGAGAHRVEAHSVDGEGRSETSPASDFIIVQAQVWQVFLPLVTSAGH